jgi:hypothetical protein
MTNYTVKDYQKAVEMFNLEINRYYESNVRRPNGGPLHPYFGDGAMLEWIDACEDAGDIVEIEMSGKRNTDGYLATFCPSYNWRHKFLEDQAGEI